MYRLSARFASTAISAFLLLLVLAPPLWSQADPEEVKIETVEVAAGIYMLVGQGGNIGVSAGEVGVFMIDGQFAPLTPKIQAAVAGRQR